MQRRIQQTNGDRKAGHLAEDADEVATLQRQKFFEGLLSGADAIGKNHLAHGSQTLIAKEHVLSAAQADAFSAKAPRRFRVQRRISIGAHAESAKLIGPLHQLMKIRTERRLNGRHLSEKDSAGGSIDRD